MPVPTSGRGGSGRLALVGAGPLAAACGNAARTRGLLPVLVVTDDATLASWALEAGVPVVDPTDGSALAERLRVDAVDWLLSVNNVRVLPDDVLAAVPCAVNFHDGPLPRYAGLHATTWAILAGEREHGVVWHRMLPAVDAGDVLVRRTVPIESTDRAYDLNARCFEAGLDSAEELLSRLVAGDLGPGEAQDRARRSWFGRYRRPDAAGAIRWDRPVLEIVDLVRGLDLGPVPNPLGRGLVLGTTGPVVATRAKPAGVAPAGAAPGTVVAVDGSRVTVAAGDGLVDVDTAGPLDVVVGDQLLVLDDEAAARLRRVAESLAPFEAAWSEALHSVVETRVPSPPSTVLADVPAAVVVELDAATLDDAVAAVLGGLVRALGVEEATVGLATPESVADAVAGDGVVSAVVPCTVGARTTADEVAAVRARRTYRVDLPERVGVPGPRPSIVVRAGTDVAVAASLVVDVAPGRSRLLAAEGCDPAWLPLVADAITHPSGFGPHTAGLLARWSEGPAGATDPRPVHELVQTGLDRDPSRHVAIDGSTSWTAAELDIEANRVAHELLARGVARGDLVAIQAGRSVRLLAAVLGVLKAGAAYVPLDPTHPPARRRLVAEDAAPVVVLADASGGPVDAAGVPVVDLAGTDVAARPHHRPDVVVDPRDAAYVLFTSGSTGRPKGVVVEHRNVANLFVAVDELVGPTAGDPWLAVTGLGFDISVLELLWTLASGRAVVVGDDPLSTAGPSVPAPTFSLSWFGADDCSGDTDRYRLLLEGARFADTHDFEAVWVPERHFHDFGGLHPNPAVSAAAVAVATERVAIRAGSCVLPLHHPARVAEEWAVVDNLSGGRVGVSFASGWRAEDFVLAPDRYADARARLAEDLDVVHRLWRGEAVELPGPDGEHFAVSTLPRPIQPELPTWLTSAGTTATFELAGRLGAGVLTHLLGQDVDRLRSNVSVYRAAWRAAGHGGNGQVTCLVHTFVAADDAAAFDVARRPMVEYLRSSVDLVGAAAAQFPTFGGAAGGAGFESLTPDDLEALLDHAADRYLAGAGMIGTVDACVEMAARLGAAGVDEIACLIDFGIDDDVVLEHLPLLDEVRRRVIDRAVEPAGAHSRPAVVDQLDRHRPRGMQCTPSLVRMLLADPIARDRLADLEVFLVGGEAVPPDLAAELVALIDGRVVDVYGPTETTVWSTAHVLDGAGGPVPIGRPLAGNQVAVVDATGAPVPIGAPGELRIGGLGVTRGYLGRPDLTADRFVVDVTGERWYRTGDVVRWRTDGVLDFLGRLDHQVKIRGHRIELGEVEAALARADGVRVAAVVPVEDAGGSVRLVAHVVADDIDERAVLSTLRMELPAAAVPSALVRHDALPLTPNGKIDRLALASLAPQQQQRVVAPPVGQLELTIAAVWSELLGVADVGRDEGFFELGGHSLLAVQGQRRLQARLEVDIPLTDLFRHPTVSQLAVALGARLAEAGAEPSTEPAPDGAARGRDRAARRRAARR